jgi:RNA polymerase sigma-70 factor (ECF subfamily)
MLQSPEPFELATADVEILARARQGCPEARGRLFSHFRSYLLRIAQDEVNAELRAKAGPSDLVQETFLEAEHLFELFAGQEVEELKPWLRAILQHKAAELRRHYHGVQKRQASRELPLPRHSSCAEQLISPENSPSRQLIGLEEQELLRNALLLLPLEQQLAIRWRNWDGLPFAEIGQRLDRSADAARMLWARGLERLQQVLEHSPHG